MKTLTLDKLIWTSIYGGLIAIGLGLAMQPAGDGLRWAFVAVGSVVAVVGTLLIVVRAKAKETP